MPSFPGVRRLFRLVVREPSVEEEIETELAFHFESTVADLTAAGMSAEQAEAEARRRFGDQVRTRDELARIDRGARRQARRADRWDAVRQDLAYAARGLRRSPGFTALIVVTMGLGIGANAVMYGIVDRLLLRPPSHVREAEGIRRVYFTQTFPTMGTRTQNQTAYRRYAMLRDSVASLDQVAAYTIFEDIAVGRGAEGRKVRLAAASAGIFPLLGVRPALGRFFLPEEDRAPEGAHVLVLGHGMWRTDFGGDSAVLGRQLLVAGEPFTIIGVAPRGFTGADYEPVAAWAPFSALAKNRVGPRWHEDQSSAWLKVVARPDPAVPLAQAASEATRAQRRMVYRNGTTDSTITVSFGPIAGLRVADGSAAKEASISIWLAAVSLVVLLIACANVANLLLARSVQRRREIAVRIALGIGRRRLVGQVLLESLLLAVLGGLAALLIARWGGDAMRAVLLPELAWDEPIVSQRVLAFTALLTLGTGILAGLLPALQASRPEIMAALKEGGRHAAPSATRTRTTLLVVQAALSTALLIGAGLFVRSLHSVNALDLGLDADRILLASINTGRRGAGALDGVYARARERISGLPGVEQASIAMGAPFNWSFATGIEVPGRDTVPTLATGGPYYNGVTPEFFATMGTALLRGRGIEPADREGGPGVMVVNETLARTVFPGEEAVGKCVIVGSDSTCTTVVGVVADARRSGIREDPTMQFYLPLAQRPDLVSGAILLVRANTDPRALIAPIRRLLLETSPDALAIDVHLLQDDVDPQIRPWRLGATMFGIFGLLALLVAAVGLYSVVAYSVTQRRHEIGVRVALGAEAGDVAGLVVGQSVRVTTVGVAAGALLALAAGRLLAPLLFETSPRDPVVLATAAVTLILVSVLASLLPAWRATRVDPRIALQAD